MFTVPAAAGLSDRVGRRAVFLPGAVAFALFAYPFFWVNDAADGSVLVFGVRPSSGSRSSLR